MNAAGWTTLSKNGKGDEENKGVKRIFHDVSSKDELQLDRHPKKQKPNSDSSGNSKKRPADTKHDTMAPAPVLRRCRFKQPDPHADVVCQLVQASQPQKRRGRPNGPAKNYSGSNRSQKLKDKDANGESHGDEMPDGSGHVDRDGKCSSLSIWRKMQIIKEYERLKALKTIKNIESFMLKNGKMKGGYQGCLSRSKWLGAREKYKWDDFIAHCPELSKKVYEVPNVLLEVLGVAAPCQTFEKTNVFVAICFHRWLQFQQIEYCTQSLV